MSQSDWFNNLNNDNKEVNTPSDVHEAESSKDIYNTPDVTGSLSNEAPAQQNPAADVVVESVPTEEIIEADAVVPYHQNPYSNQYNNNPYGNNSYDNNSPYGNNPYSGQMPHNGGQGNNTYNNNPYSNNPYNNNTYNNNTYNNNTYNNNPYNNNNTYGNNSYGGQTPQNGGQGNNAYNNNAYNNNPYNNNQYGNSPYNNNPYGNNQYGNGPSGNPPYGNNQYSPYAVPPKKNKTGLIIGIVIAIIVLFLIAVFALVYKAMSLYTQDRGRARGSREEYRFDYDEDDWKKDRNQNNRNQDYDDYGYDDYDYDDWYDDYDYDDWYDDYNYDDWYDDYDYDDDQYYTFHNDIKYNLSYSVDFEYYEYDTDYENVYIMVEYPVIEGKNVPNLDKLNSTIREEVDFFTEFFEEEYEEYITDEYSFFSAYSTGYVTYMDEEKLSIAFEEYIYSDYYDDVYLYCININMENGVILDNENILSIDDNFSVDFRQKSDIQNGEISYLTMMSDQEITDYFNSSDVIVLYTPMGMEIGFNYEEGWVTVTYEEYEQYLKVF